jgi:hypothetical protein
MQKQSYRTIKEKASPFYLTRCRAEDAKINKDKRASCKKAPPSHANSNKRDNNTLESIDEAIVEGKNGNRTKANLHNARHIGGVNQGGSASVHPPAVSYCQPTQWPPLF